MKSIFIITFLSSLLLFSLTSCHNNIRERRFFGEAYAKQMLEVALNETHQHNLIDNHNIIIKDSLMVIAIAEPILFSIYGRENIVNQRPYENHLINNYWVINGTLQKEYVGGTFLIIIDSHDGRIIKLTHGK